MELEHEKNTCYLCNVEFSNTHSLGQHIRYVHKLSKKEYLDEVEGFHKCPYCENERKWHRNLYLKTCGATICAHKELENSIRSKYGDNYRQRIAKEIWSNEELKNKQAETVSEKWHVLPIEEQERRVRANKETKLIKHGDANYNNSNKIKETCLVKYGVDNCRKCETVKDKIKLKRNENYIVPRWNELFSSKLEKYRISYNVYRCLKCDNVMVGCFCEKCDDIDELNRTRSNFELEIIKEIRKFYSGEISTLNRKLIEPLELDIYIPEFNLAIEADGVYFHRGIENGKKMLKKTEMCEQIGLRLLHIYDLEWKYKKAIILDKIRSMMGYNEKVFARKCEIVEISNDYYAKFCNEYHIQGVARAKYRYGLKYENEIVAIASFNKSRFKDEIELIRYCSKSGISVIGGMKKLVKHFKVQNGVTKIVSYADRRFTSRLSNVYGLENLISVTKPGYQYFRGYKFYNRIQFQKHKLKDNEFTKEFYDDMLSEKEICDLAGFSILYDCGQLKFEL